MDTSLLSGAQSPQVLTRLLEAVSRGVRSPRGLQEVLGLSGPLVRAYVHAGAWLSLVESVDPVCLSALGLEYVYAGERRPEVYARAVWSNPLAAELLTGAGGTLPERAATEAALLRAAPDATDGGPERTPAQALSEPQVRAVAAAVLGLVAPAVGRALSEPQQGEQLVLPLSHAPPIEPPPTLPPAAEEHDPDAYRYVLAWLLDHGELSVGHLRALLDRAGASALPLGGLLDLAGARGDAVRIGDRLVATAGAVARAPLLSSTPSLLLSDPGYRAWLLEQAGALPPSPRRDSAVRQYRRWDRRLLGLAERGGPHPERASILALLEQSALGRPLADFPVAEPEPAVPLPETRPFLDVWERPGLRVALPPSLAQLQGGLEAANRVLRQQRGAGVALPDLGDRPVVVHAGIVHPGEPPPRSVPDTRTLRLRLLMHSPYPAAAAALLLLHRMAPDRCAIVDSCAGWVVQRARLPSHEVPLLTFLDDFARSRSWLPVRRPWGGLRETVFVSLLELLGIAVSAGGTLVLAEPLFSHLLTCAEEMEVYARLRPLADAMDAFLWETR